MTTTLPASWFESLRDLTRRQRKALASLIGCLGGVGLLLAGLLFAAGPAQAQAQAESAQQVTTVFGPRNAQITAARGRQDAFTDIQLYSRSPRHPGAYRLVVDNASAALAAGRGVNIEIWHNMRKVVSTTDLFTAAGQPIARVSKAIDTRNFLNLVIVKINGRSPVRLSWRIEAGQETLPPPLLSGVAPVPLNVANGSSGVLTLSIAPPPRSAGQIQLVSADPAIAQVAASVPYGIGQTQVAVPVQGLGVGTTTIVAGLTPPDGGTPSSLTASVWVNPAPPRIIDITPAQTQIQQGAYGLFRINITPAQLTPVQITLSNSAPDVLSVPTSTALGPGQTQATFAAQALAVGNAQITASIGSEPNASQAFSQVQVVPQPVRVVSLLPANSVLQQGSSVNLNLTLSAAQSQATQVNLLSANPAIASVPAQIQIPAGAVQASIAVQGQGVGNTLIEARLGEGASASSVQAAIQVNPAPAAIASLLPAQADLTQGAQTALQLRLNAAQTTPTAITLSSAPAGIVQVPGELIIPAGQTQGAINVSALSVGQAQVSATLGTSVRSSVLNVTPQPLALESLLPNPLALQAGASGQLKLRLSASQPQAVTISLNSSDPQRLQLPPSVNVPAGQVEQTIAIQALLAGEVTVTASTQGANSVQTQVQIAEPAPRIASLLPATQNLPKGKVGTLRLTLDRAPIEAVGVTIANDAPLVLGAPSSATVPAGQLGADIPVTALTTGSATLSASLSLGGQDSNAQAQVQVVEPELSAIRIQPDAVNISAGQSVELRATGTYSDGSERDISADTATAWSTLDPTVATISAQGRLSGLSSGTTAARAMQAVLPTHGNPEPQPVIGQAPVTVAPGQPLALSTPNASLQVGQSAVVSITSPYAAGATPIAITLQSSGSGAIDHPATASIGPGLTSVNISVTASRAGSVSFSASAPQYASASLGFTVSEAPLPGITVSAITPQSAAPGATVRLTGSGFASPASDNSVSFAGGALAPVTSGSATELVVQVPALAQSGPITVSTAVGGPVRSGQSPVFTVLREQDFGLTASPANLQIVQGSAAAASLQLSSTGTQAFEGLAKLTVTGLPPGVSAEFDPPSLSAVQSGKLVLRAASDAPFGAGAALLTIRAEARINGQPWVRESQLSAQVVVKAAGLTAVKGRFVTPEGKPVAGVIVRQDTTTNQVTTDAAGNFFLQGLSAGTTTLRFDATPANPLYPIWPMNVNLIAGELRTYEDWVINPPPENDKFKAINNATVEQRITDERFPGFEVVLPAGASITGWDGVKKTRIAIERILPDKLPVEQPPFAMKEAYQLYFGTPMGGIPSQPIPVTLPNVAEQEPGGKVDIWWFDGSPMGGTGEWKKAGQGTVSADGTKIVSDPGVGLPRFCGVCGLVSVDTNCPKPPEPPQPPPSCPAPKKGNPIDLLTGQAFHSTAGMSCSGQTPIELAWRYNPVDSFQNKAFTRASFGMGWSNAYDIVFLPFAGVQKRMIMPGGIRVNFSGSGSGDHFAQHPLFQGVVARQIGNPDSALSGTPLGANTLTVPIGSRFSSSSGSSSGGGGGGGGSSTSLNARSSVLQGTTWEVLYKDGTRWIFEPYSGFASISPGQFQRGGPPSWLTRIIDRNGNVTRISRSPSGKLTRIEGADGRQFSLALNDADHVSRITDHTGRVTQIEYTEDHRVASMTDPEGRQTRYDYQSLPLYSGPRHISAYAGNNTFIRSSSSGSTSGGGSSSGGTVPLPPVACADHMQWLDSKKIVFTGAAIDPPPLAYPLFKGLKEIHYPGVSQPTVNTYSTDRVLRQVASNGEVRRFAYRRTGACVAKVAPNAPFFANVPDLEAAATLVVVPLEPTNGVEPGPFTCLAGSPYKTTNSGVCTSGNCPPIQQGMCPEIETEETHAAGWRFYGGSNTETIVTEPNGATIRYRFNAERLPIEYIDELGQSTKYEYDGSGQLAKVIDPLERETRVQYNSLGQLLSQSGPLGRRVDYSYHPLHLQRTQTTQYLATPSEQGGNSYSHTALTSNFNHDERGNLKSIRDPLGHITQNLYDDKGRLIESIAMAGVGTSSIPVLRDGIQTSVPINERKSRFEYNPAGDLIAISDTLGQQTRYSTDPLGRVVAVLDPLHFTTQQQYDKTDLPTITTDALGQESRQEYDAAGRVTAIFNAAGVAVERYEYDSLGRRIRTIAPDGGVTSVEYDSMNRISAVTDRKGQRITSTYTPTGRLASIGTPERSINYTYDTLGRLSEVSDASTTASYRYDEAGRTIQVDTTTVAGSHRLAYEYDSLDRTTKRTLSGSGIPTPEVTAYIWDHANRLTEQKTRIGPADNLTEHQTSYSYDPAARLQSRSSQIKANGTSEPRITQRYHYDEVDRLTRIEYLQTTPSSGGGQGVEQLIERIDYQYDARGQRIGKTTLNNHGTGQSETPMEAAYDISNRMLSITIKPSADASTHKTWNLSYDANGNLTQKQNAANANEKTTYTWDSENRLTGLTKTENGETVTANHQYDLFGRRIISTIQQGSNAADTVHYLYEGQQALGEIRNQSLSHRLITGLSLDETIARIAIAGTGAADVQVSRQYLTDALNSVIAQANAQGGGIANSYGYSPYGESQTIGPDATGNTAQYTSRENDAQGATGLYFYRARYYDPVLKRFVSEDPIGLAGGMNKFGYVGGDPLSYTDPRGLKKFGKNHPHCKAIRDKKAGLQNELDTRWSELVGGLPERIGPGEKMSQTMRGHRKLINKAESNLRYWEKKYDEDCDDNDPDDGENTCDECSAGATVTTAVVGAGLAYGVYRCVRMLPSLFPPLWWTIPANTAVP